MERLYLGIDLGTSAMKIVLMNENKKVLSYTTECYSLSNPHEGWNEINQEIWFESLINGIQAVLEGQEKKNLRSIGITGQMHTLVVVDKEGDYIRPAIMWNDLRTKEMIPQMKKIMESFEDGEYLSKTISIGSPAANLYWIKENEPANFSKIGKFLIGPDYLVYRLTGCYGTDYCEASTSCLYEIENRKWSVQMREFLGLNEEVYPNVHGSECIVGNVKEDIAKLLGIPTDVAVIAGTGDNPATAISTGCLTKGYPVISLGTSGVLMSVISPEDYNGYGKKILFSFDGEKYFNLVQGSVQSNGRTLAWWNEEILGGNDFTCIDEIVDLEKEKHNEIVFYPHLAGEKTIYGDPSIRGTFVGLSVDSTKESLTYSILEGLCFAFRELSEKMNLSLDEQSSMKIVGGGSNSKVWMQIFANVLNLPVEKLDGMIGAAFGIALLALYQDNGKQDYEELMDNTINVQQRFEPDMEMVNISNKKYQIYKRMHDGLKYIVDNDPLHM